MTILPPIPSSSGLVDEPSSDQNLTFTDQTYKEAEDTHKQADIVVIGRSRRSVIMSKCRLEAVVFVDSTSCLLDVSELHYSPHSCMIGIHEREREDRG